MHGQQNVKTLRISHSPVIFKYPTIPLSLSLSCCLVVEFFYFPVLLWSCFGLAASFKSELCLPLSPQVST